MFGCRLSSDGEHGAFMIVVHPSEPTGSLILRLPVRAANELVRNAFAIPLNQLLLVVQLEALPLLFDFLHFLYYRLFKHNAFVFAIVTNGGLGGRGLLLLLILLGAYA